MNDNQCLFSWESSGNPNDPSGVAKFKVGAESVAVLMIDFREALKLDRLIQKACDRTKQQVIDRALLDISRILKEHRYN